MSVFFPINCRLGAICLVFFVFSTSLSAQIYVPDTLSGISWVRLDGPPGTPFVSDYSNGRWWAGCQFGLYYLDSTGVRWEPVPAFHGKDVRGIAATPLAVLVHTYTETVTYSPLAYHGLHQLYLSTDGGISFSLQYEVTANIDQLNNQVALSGLRKKNDHTFIWRSRYGSGFSGDLQMSDDLGTTWKNLSSFNPVFVHVHADTVLLLENTPDNLIPATRYGSNDWSAAQFDTLNFPPDFPTTVAGIFYRDGRYIAYSTEAPPRVAVSTDYGHSWQISTTNGIPGQVQAFTFPGECVLARIDSGYYRASLSAPGEFSLSFVREKIWTVPVSPTAGQALMMYDWKGIFLTYDGGVSWEEKGRGFSASIPGFLGYAGKRHWLRTTQDHDHYRTGVNTETWETVSDSLYAAGLLVVTEQNGVWLGNMGNSWYRSVDEGATWQFAYSFINEPIEENDGRLYFWHEFDGGNPIVYTSDGGANWTGFSAPMHGLFYAWQDTFVILSQYLVDPVLGTFDYIRSVSHDAGATWQSDTTSGPYLLNILRDSDRLVGIFDINSSGNSLYVHGISNDKGLTWTYIIHPGAGPYPFNQPLPDTRFAAGGIVMGRSGTGLWVSRDYGAHWSVPGPGPYVGTGTPFYRLAGDSLYVFTQGYGVWRTSFSALRQNLPQYGQVTGRAWKESDGNCQFDSTDTALAGKVIRVGNIFFTQTDSVGRYKAIVPEGVYPVGTLPVLHTNAACDTLSALNTAIGAGSSAEVNFVFSRLPGITDLSVTLSPLTALRPGFEARYRVLVRNLGSDTVKSAQLVFQYAPAYLSFSGAVPAGQPGTGTVSFSIDTLAPDTGLSFELTFQVSSLAPVGTALTFVADVALASDALPDDNTATLQQTVTASLDPNVKQVFTDGKVLPATANTLEYLIRFQNLGTDTAFRVVVFDTLPDEIDLYTLETVDASHPWTLEIGAPNRVAWIFDPIQLPQASANPAASQGFVRFRVRTHSTLTVGEKISNRAAIYFDYNQPVMTPPAVSTVEKNLFFQTASVELCANETYNGVLYSASTLLSDTVAGPTYDSVYQIQITVHPVYNIQIDTTLSGPGIVADVFCSSDTAFVYTGISADGCDSTVAYQVEIFTSPAHDTRLIKVIVTAYPNPAVVGWTVRVDGLGPEEAFSLELRTMEGCLLQRMPFRLNEQTIIRGSLPSGSYRYSLADRRGMYLGSGVLILAQ